MNQVNLSEPDESVNGLRKAPERALASKEYDQNVTPTKEEETAQDSAGQEKCRKISLPDRSPCRKSRNLFPRMDPITSKGFISRVMLQLKDSSRPKTRKATKVILIILAAVFIGVLVAVIFKILGGTAFIPPWGRR